MLLFPFDTQFCSIKITTNGKMKYFTNVILENAKYTGAKSFSGFSYSKVESCIVKTSGSKELRWVFTKIC